MTVLILAPELDITADRMVKLLEQRAVPVVRFDTAWFPQRSRFEAYFDGGQWVGTLASSTHSVVLEGLRSIWYRNPSAFDPPAGLSPAERHWAMTEAKLGLGGVLAALPVRWVNHPARTADASYKPVQLATAVRCGLTVPDTLISNHVASVRRFAESATVTKTLGAPTIREEGAYKTAFTHVMTEADRVDLHGVEVTAHQFQRWVPKEYEARVLVVGDSVFGCAIHAHTAETYVDWRNDYAALSYSPVAVPPEVAAGALEYCVTLQLCYAAFDFVVTPDGQWVFLECNPGGQFGWIEDETGLPITETLGDVLASGGTP